MSFAEDYSEGDVVWCFVDRGVVASMHAFRHLNASENASFDPTTRYKSIIFRVNLILFDMLNAKKVGMPFILFNPIENKLYNFYELFL